MRGGGEKDRKKSSRLTLGAGHSARRQDNHKVESLGIMKNATIWGENAIFETRRKTKVSKKILISGLKFINHH